MNNQTRISLIIPVYNEERNIPVLFDEIKTALRDGGTDWEVLFVDDGSRDRSLEVLRGLTAREARVRYISLERNCGQSAAFSAGFKEAAGDVIVTLDADLQNDPADIPAMLGYFAEGYDMVIGWRGIRQDSFVRRAASKIANSVRNALSHENVRDTGCSLKVLRADMARLIPMYKGMHRFLPTLMKMQGARVLEVKVNHRPRLYGESKYGIWDRAWQSFCDLLAVRWMQSRDIKYSVKERG